MNVVPAVCAGLFGLFRLSSRSTMSCAGPAARSSWASRRPPGRPSSSMTSLSLRLGSANGRSPGNSRPNRSSPLPNPVERCVAAGDAPRQRRRHRGRADQGQKPSPINSLVAIVANNGHDRLPSPPHRRQQDQVHRQGCAGRELSKASGTLPVDRRVSKGHRRSRRRWPSGEFRLTPPRTRGSGRGRPGTAPPQ